MPTKLVPLEPTEEMIAAAIDASYADSSSMAVIYKAMLSAAPSPPSDGGLVERAEQRSMALLKLAAADRTVYFVLDTPAYRDAKDSDAEYQSHREYFYEEHSCPTNWINSIVAVIENGDTDPHGFLQFVKQVPVANDFDEDDDKNWQKLFPEAFVAAELSRLRAGSEPVAWLCDGDGQLRRDNKIAGVSCPLCKPLYAAPAAPAAQKDVK
jgi:hypothetical protein